MKSYLRPRWTPFESSEGNVPDMAPLSGVLKLKPCLINAIVASMVLDGCFFICILEFALESNVKAIPEYFSLEIDFVLH